MKFKKKFHLCIQKHIMMIFTTTLSYLICTFLFCLFRSHFLTFFSFILFRCKRCKRIPRWSRSSGIPRAKWHTRWSRSGRIPRSSRYLEIICHSLYTFDFFTTVTETQKLDSRYIFDLSSLPHSNNKLLYKTATFQIQKEGFPATSIMMKSNIDANLLKSTL